MTLEEKRTLKIYTIANLLAFIFQVAVVFFSNLHTLINPNIDVLDKTVVTVIPEIFATEVILIFLLEFAFVIIPLPCMRFIGPRQHFQNILLLKVKWFFIVQCLFQSVAIFSFTLSEKKWFNEYPVNFAGFFLLKCYVHYFGYRKVKYLDDGRDYVSFKEFFSIHITFSVINSWMTYFVIYTFF